MSDLPPKETGFHRPPLHLWVVGLLSLLWNVWGAYIALSAQSGTLPTLRAEDQAFFEAQPLWLVIVADAALLSGICGALALLLQHRSAVWFYAVKLAILIFTNAYEIAAGTSLLLSNPTAALTAVWLAAVMLAEVGYAYFMRRRRVLE